MMTPRLPIFQFMFIIALTTQVGVAQNRVRELTVTGQAKPSFKIEPIVQRLSGRRGQTIQFKFDMASVARATNIEIQPVALRQEENGTILPDTESEPPTALKLLSPSTMELAKDSEFELKGSVKIPNLQTPFHSFGLLVTDHGREIGSNTAAGNGTSVGVRFITRYLLRIDVSVPGVRSPNLSKIQIEHGELVESYGLPRAVVYLVNPTDAPLECNMHCLFSTDAGSLPEKPFDLVQPVRQNLEDDDRVAVRILPKSRIRVEETVPYPIFPGEYTLIARLHERNRPIQEATFATATFDGQFPGLDSTYTALSEQIIASPGNLTLSLQKGGSRYLPIAVTNKSEEPIEIHTSAIDKDGAILTWAVTRPAKLILPPGGTRKFVASMGTDRQFTAPRYGNVLLKAVTADGQPLGDGKIQLAQLPSKTPMAQLTVGELRWENDANTGPSIVIPVTNPGEVHAILSAHMRLMNDRGQKFDFVAGYHRWVLPGESDELSFRLKDPIPAGIYEMKFEIDPGPGADKLSGKTKVEIAGPNNKQATNAPK